MGPSNTLLELRDDRRPLTSLIHLHDFVDVTLCDFRVTFCD